MLTFEGEENEYARFLEDYTTYPFDNFPGIVVTPRYGNEPGLVLQNTAGDFIEVDNSGNRLDHS
jgi:hypothetical protein